MPVHEHKPHHRNKFKALVTGLLAATVVTLAFATFLLQASIPLTVVLPTAAPIWVGITMMAFSLLEKK